MSNKILKITEKVPKAVTLPDGNYIGTWGGYTIEVVYQQKSYELTTEEGVRGMGFKVIVEIINGEATFEEIKN
jgi:hypothetical protein